MVDDTTKVLAREDQIKLHTSAKKKKDRGTIRGRELDLDADFKPPKYKKSDSAKKFLDGALGDNFIFSDLSKKERKMLIDAMQEQKAAEGDIIIQQGDVGDFFYICESGNLVFNVDGNNVGGCSVGGSFGELALLYDSPRAATCVAASDVTLWKVDQTTFRYLIASTAKEQETGIVEILAKIPLLKDMSRGLVSKFAACLTTVKFSEGDLIVKKGEQGDVFYIINEGQVKVHDIGGGAVADMILKSGEWFGERALMTGEPRAANITAMTDVVAFACDRDTFESSVGSLEGILGDASKKRFIKGVPIFANSSLLEVEYDRLVKRLTVEQFSKGTKIAEAGKKSHQKLMIVKEGKLKVTNSSGTTYSLAGGDFFGDEGVRGPPDAKEEYTCVAEEDTQCWVLSRRGIEKVIKDVKRLGKAIPFVPSTVDSSITLADIKKHRILGMGKKEACIRRRSKFHEFID